jgi:tRNA-dependent cyclodipeptide synthase
MDLLINTPELSVSERYDDIFYRSGSDNFGKLKLLIGMSPGNGYFTEDNMVKLISGLCQYVPGVYILIPDKPHIYNFLGMGYTPKQAQKKSKKDINQTKNRLKRAVDRLVNDQGVSNFSVVDWESQVAASSRFRIAIDQIMAEYAINTEFREMTNQLTFEYLIGRVKDRTVHKIDVNQGVIYYLEELALFASQNEIFGEDLTVCYYRKWGEGLDCIANLFPGFAKTFSILQYSLKESTPVQVMNDIKVSDMRI